jgi:nitrate reductase NapAB chaperone NapD
MKLKQIEEADEKIIVFTQIKRLNKIVDKLEQRIATLEKVLPLVPDCIVYTECEMREEKTDV